MKIFQRGEVVVRLNGGLGNQLFQYAVGRQISLLRKADLKLDLTAFEHEKDRTYKMDLYNISAAIASEKLLQKYTAIYEQSSLYARIYRKAEAKILPRHKRRFFKESDYYIYEPALLSVVPDVMIEGFWQHYKYFENLHPTVLQELTLKEKYKKPAPAVWSEIEQNSASVSLHIRRGDYVSDPGNLSWFGVMPISYYQQAMDYLIGKIGNPTFFVFSDDLDWARQNLRSSAPLVFVDIDGGKKEYLDLEAMSKCRHHIIANSSFSWWGAYFNRNKEKIVVAPAKWIADEEVDKNVGIQFPDWIKI